MRYFTRPGRPKRHASIWLAVPESEGTLLMELMCGQPEAYHKSEANLAGHSSLATVHSIGKGAGNNAVIWTWDAAATLFGMRLRDHVDSGGWTITRCIDMDPPAILRLSTTGLQVDVWDVRNWFPLSMVEMVAGAKNQTEWNAQYQLLGLTLGVDPSDQLAALVVAIQCVYRSCQQMIGLWPSATPAAHAVRVYAEHQPLALGSVARQLNHWWGATVSGKPQLLPLLHDDEGVTAMERSCLAGASVSVFRGGALHPEVECWDRNSYYLSLLRRLSVPVKLHHAGYGWHDLTPYVGPEKWSGWVECSLDSDDTPYPYRRKNRWRYARGKFETVLAWPEFIMAVNAGHVEAIRRWGIYKAERLMADYAEHMLDVKARHPADGDPLGRSIAKSVGNALWGKWGQLNQDWRLRPGVYPPERWCAWMTCDADTATMHQWRSLGGRVEEMVGQKEARHSLPIISAVVTSAARVDMLAAIRSVPCDAVLYAYVDGLHLTAGTSKPWPSEQDCGTDKPGVFTLREVLHNVQYLRPGWFRSQEKIVHAGVPLDAYMDREGNYRAEMRQGLKHLLTTPYLARLESAHVRVVPPESVRCRKRPPRSHKELWPAYRERDLRSREIPDTVPYIPLGRAT